MGHRGAKRAMESPSYCNHSGSQPVTYVWKKGCRGQGDVILQPLVCVNSYKRYKLEEYFKKMLFCKIQFHNQM